MIYFINFEGIGDAWYSIPVLRAIAKFHPEIDVYSACEPLQPILSRFDFINLLSKEETLERVNGGESLYKLFRIDDAKQRGLTLLNCDTTDFITKTLFDRVLTDNAKEVQYPLIQTKEFKRYDLVFHVAKTWESRSISKEVWQKLYDRYSKNYSIALIGQTTKALDMVKDIVHLDVPKEDNFVNKLSLDETMNLINSSRILVTGQGGISVLSAGLPRSRIVVAEGCVHSKYRPIIRKNSRHYYVKYVKNPSGIYHTGDITPSVINDTRQQPTFEDMVSGIENFL